MQRIVIISVSVASLVIGLTAGFAVKNTMNIKELNDQLVALQAAKAEEDAHGGATAEGLRPNVVTDFNATVDLPTVPKSVYIDPKASVIGNVELGERVYVAPFASVRGDEGQPIHIGDDSNIQDGVVLHALETQSEGKNVEGRTYKVGARAYAIYVGERVSMAHQALVHGPARVDDDVFIGMQAMVFKARIGAGCVVEPAAKVIGVTVPAGRYVPAGSVITTQAAADALPAIYDGYPFQNLNEAVVHVNTSFAEAYGGGDLSNEAVAHAEGAKHDGGEGEEAGDEAEKPEKAEKAGKGETAKAESAKAESAHEEGEATESAHTATIHTETVHE